MPAIRVEVLPVVIFSGEAPVVIFVFGQKGKPIVLKIGISQQVGRCLALTGQSEQKQEKQGREKTEHVKGLRTNDVSFAGYATNPMVFEKKLLRKLRSR